MFKKSIPIIFIGLSVVVAMLVLGWVIFVKPEVPVQVPVTGKDEIISDDVFDDVKEDDVMDDVDDNIDDNSISEIDTSDWKTYRNEEFGFELKYPEHWIIESPAYKGNSSRSGNAYHILGMTPYGFEGDWSILVTVIPQSVDEILKDNNYYWNKSWKIANKENVLINNISAQKVTWSNSAILIYFQKPDKSFTVQFDGCYNKKRPESNDILSTFRFIK